MLSQVLSVDLALLRLINREWTSPALDLFFGYISDFGTWKWGLLIVILAVIFRGGFRGRVFLALMALCLLFGDALLTQGIRQVVNRPRPWQAESEVRYVTPRGVEIRGPTPWEKGRSLPSGHVCNNVSFAVLVFLFFGPGKWALLAGIWAALIAYSRVYTGSHYPTDVAVSLVLALIYAPLVCVLANRLWRAYGRRLMPQTFSQHPVLWGR
jgi:undecaprenyl-diphosphatase